MEFALTGAPAHTRTLSVTCFQADGGATVRASLADIRKRGLIPLVGNLQTNGFVHLMHVEAAVSDAFRIDAIRAQQPQVAIEASETTGGDCCRDPIGRIEALVGTPVDDAFAKRLGAAIGGPLGCSHILTLSQLLGSTLLTAHAANRQAFPDTQRPTGERWFERNLSFDGVEDGETLRIALQLSDVHMAPSAASPRAEDRLAGSYELRIEASIRIADFVLTEIHGADRVCDADTFAIAPWTEVEVGYLAGHSARAGTASRIFANASDTPKRRPLRDALLNLAPAAMQCIPALAAGAHLFRGGAKRDGNDTRAQDSGPFDSCYMWRREGGIHRVAPHTPD